MAGGVIQRANDSHQGLKGRTAYHQHQNQIHDQHILMQFLEKRSSERWDENAKVNHQIKYWATVVSAWLRDP